MVTLIYAGYIVNIIAFLVTLTWTAFRVHETIGLTEFLLYASKKKESELTWKRIQQRLIWILPFAGILLMSRTLWEEYTFFKKNPQATYYDLIDEAYDKN